MTQPSQFELRNLDDCGHPYGCDCTPRHQHGADMTKPWIGTTTPLAEQPVEELLGAHVTAQIRGHIIALQAKEYPGLPGPTTAQIQLTTGGTITLPLTALTLTDPT